VQKTSVKTSVMVTIMVRCRKDFWFLTTDFSCVIGWLVKENVLIKENITRVNNPDDVEKQRQRWGWLLL